MLFCSADPFGYLNRANCRRQHSDTWQHFVLIQSMRIGNVAQLKFGGFHLYRCFFGIVMYGDSLLSVIHRASLKILHHPNAGMEPREALDNRCLPFDEKHHQYNYFNIVFNSGSCKWRNFSVTLTRSHMVLGDVGRLKMWKSTAPSVSSSTLC